jgi:hypothetical protein
MKEAINKEIFRWKGLIGEGLIKEALLQEKLFLERLNLESQRSSTKGLLKEDLHLKGLQ